MALTPEQLKVRLETVEGARRFGDRVHWKSSDEVSACFQEMLFPHAEDYVSRMRPLFLQQLKHVDFLEELSPILVRDGWLGTLYFFFSNPTPPSKDAFLILPSRFADLVPDAWRSQVTFYSVKPHAGRAIEAQSVRQVFLILTPIDAKQCSEAHAARLISELRAFLGEHIEQIPLHTTLCLNPITTDERGISDRQRANTIGLISTLTRHLDRAVVYLSWDQIQAVNPTDSIFVDFNEHDFYYSDSAIAQSFLRRGAIPFPFATLPTDSFLELPVSFGHTYELLREGRPTAFRRERVMQELRTYQESSLLAQEQAGFSPAEDSFSSGRKFCPLSFEAMAWNLLQ